jgi:Fe-S cluster biogenesis protein NfuA
MFIQTETTPNPASLKFLPGRVVMERGTADFRSVEEANSSILAQNLFKIEGVEGVFFGSDFISITKSENFDWQILKPSVLGAISVHYESGASIIDKIENTEKNSTVTKDSEIVVQIKELLDTKVRPAVAMDGGDIAFSDFKDGIVFLHMQGACSGCPSSTATLKAGIENMLKHYLPEVQGVEPVMD